MKVRNSDVKAFVDFLYDLKLPAKKSRLRSKLVRLGQEHLKNVQVKQNDLLKKFAEYDDEGNMLTSTEGENTIVHLTDTEAYQKELKILLDECWTIDENDENRDMLLAVKGVVLDFDGELEGDEANTYAMVCDALEQVEYEGDKDNE
jgi:hypothetical protein